MPVSTGTHFGKIIWAFDIFGGDRDMIERTSRTIQALVAGRMSTIEPVFVTVPAERELISSGKAPGETKFPSAGLQRWIDEFGIPGIPPLTALWERSNSVRASVDLLLEYASERHADLIVLGAKATLGVSDPMIGHFAKSLMHHSKIPLFIMGRRSRAIDKFEKILFPTDFTTHSAEVLEEILPLAKELGAKVTLFHETKCLLAEGGTAPADCFEQGGEMLRERSEEWSRAARKRGAEIAVIVDHTSQDVGPGIAAQAERMGADLITLSSRSGVLTAELFGSLAESVVSKATCPVWLLHEIRSEILRLPERKRA